LDPGISLDIEYGFTTDSGSGSGFGFFGYW